MRGDRALLSRRALLGALAFFVLALTLAALLIQRSHDDARAELLERFEERANTGAALLEDVLRPSAAQEARSAAEFLSGSGVSDAALTRYARRFGVPRDDHYVFDADGRLLAAHPHGARLRSGAVAPDPGLKPVPGLPSLGDRVAMTGGGTGIPLAYSFDTPDGSRILVDVLPARIFSNTLEPILDEVVAEGEALLLLDSAGNALIEIGEAVNNAAIAAARRADKLDENSGTFDRGGTEQRFTTAGVAGSHARLLLAADDGELLAPVESGIWVTWTLLGAFALALLGAFAVLNRALTRRAELALAEQRLLDRLTGLPNRALFVDRVAESLTADGDGRQSAVAVFDLDHFKRINDALGQPAGDAALVEIGNRLLELAPHRDLACFGGDEFALLRLGVEGEESVAGLAREIESVIRPPLVVAGQEVFLEASIGVAIGTAGEPPERLIESADTAMHLAKTKRTRFELARPEVRERATEDLQVEAELRYAIGAGEIVIHYQPIVELPAGRIVAVEALARWQHPRAGLLGPGAFIPLAEESGVIVALGAEVLARSCKEASRWRVDGRQVVLHVNLSPRQLGGPEIVDTVASALAAAGLSASALSLEVTEEVLGPLEDAALGHLDALKELGVEIAIDDFGTGESSMRRLATMECIDTVKIDRSFVMSLDQPRERAIVESLLELSAALALVAIAEGVETAEQLEVLQSLGCRLAQGFHLGRPQPADEIDSLLGEAVGFN